MQGLRAEDALVRLARVVAFLFLLLVLLEFWRNFVRPQGIDFAAFWAAAKLAIAGDAASAYDLAAHRAAQGDAAPSEGRLLAFAYPPPFLFLLLPLGLLSYAAAYVAWTAATFPFYLAAARPLWERPCHLWFAASFPPVLVNAAVGQAGFLLSALFVVGILAVGRRPLLGGLLLGCLIVKPHLAVLIPFALFAGGHWRAILGAALSSAGLLALGLLAFGPAAYAGFAAMLPVMGEGAAAGLSGWHKMATIYSLLRSAGLPETAAWIGHAALAAAATAAAILYWRADHPAKVAVLAAATAMVSPYLYAYDLLLLILPFAWLLGGGERIGPSRIGAFLLALAWLAPLAQLWLPLGLAGLSAPLMLGLIVAHTGLPSLAPAAQGAYPHPPWTRR